MSQHFSIFNSSNVLRETTQELDVTSPFQSFRSMCMRRARLPDGTPDLPLFYQKLHK